MRRRLLDDPEHDVLARTDRRVGNDRIETFARDGIVEASKAGVGVRHGVRTEVPPRELHRAFVGVRHHHAAVRDEGRRHDPEDPVSAPQVQHVGSGIEAKGLRKQLRAAVNRAA